MTPTPSPNLVDVSTLSSPLQLGIAHEKLLHAADMLMNMDDDQPLEEMRAALHLAAQALTALEYACHQPQPQPKEK